VSEVPVAASTLSSIEDFHDDLNERDQPVASQLVRHLADPGLATGR
jgi:hypothetical protein